MAKLGKRALIDAGINQTGVAQSLGGAWAAVSASVGMTVLEELDVTLIDADPTNSRDLGFVNFKNPGATKTDSLTPKQQQLWERLLDLASNLRATKRLVNPIEVFQNEAGRYTLVHGHRRYIASRLAELRLIRAQITAADSPQKKLIQWAENFHSEQLALPERIAAFTNAYTEIHDNAAAYSSLLQKNGELTERDIASVLGMAGRTLRYYKAAMSAPMAVNKAIEEGVVSRVVDAATLSTIHDEALVAKAIEALRLGDRELFEALLSSANSDEEPPTPKPTPMPEEPKQAPRAGRKRQSISTKQIKSPVVVKFIFEKVGRPVDDVDWTDLDAVTNAWQGLLDELTKELESD